jgi:hypothetical protein
MPKQPRRQTPRSFLDASLGPVENALRQRAEVIARRVLEMPAALPTTGEAEIIKDAVLGIVLSSIADEFLSLAEELHHW